MNGGETLGRGHVFPLENYKVNIAFCKYAELTVETFISISRNSNHDGSASFWHNKTVFFKLTIKQPRIHT
ncbi:unnamed protein product [Haemonchus placei]|uniref:Uncharacterized protein n=1 Tax=Haemonchus placei TaxID=6290 RepID=A0A0N4WUT0_HAEPC|nr:unnamed protein product [Haemonchus placei]